MKRERSGRSREGATLGDALSPPVKDRLHRLRDTLEKRAQETIASQLSAARPPWRCQWKPTTSPQPLKAKNAPGSAPPGPVVRARQPERQRLIFPAKLKTPRTSKPSQKSQKPTFEYWDFPSEAAVREPPPVSISDADKSSFEELLRAGTESSTACGEELFVILGLDFGTSSTKVIVRLPYEAGEPTLAIPAPATCRSDSNPYLWQTVLWLMADGVFRPWPVVGATVLNSLKQGLIQGRSETAISHSNTAFAVSRAQAAVAYLAFVIRYVRGWLLHNKPSLFVGRKPVWFVNLGMPTASYDDSSLARPYQRIAAAALQLAKIDNPVTAEATQLFLDEPHVVSAGKSSEVAERLGIAVIPEAAAEVAAFAKSTRNAPGLYLLVDVGAMTLDACMFRLKQDAKMGNRYSFLTAQVRPLGVDAFHWFLAEGKKEPEFTEQCNRTLWSVVWKAKKCRDPRATNWKPGYDVPVFLAGGGATNRLHRNIVECLGPWLKRHTGNDGIRLLDIPVPSAIDLPEPLHDFGRMAVAWGLSYPLTEIGQIQAMSDIEDVPPLGVVDFSNGFISKDVV